MSSRLRHYAILVGVAILLSGGSAYAGGAIARNSVGTFQVRDNSLRSVDVRNGSLLRGDITRGQVPRTYTVIRRVPEGSTRVLSIPGFSRFDVACSASSITLNVAFGDATPTADDPDQLHGLVGSDIGDNSPKGGATITGFGGGVGFSTGGGAAPGSGVLVRGDYWGRSQDLLAHGTFAWGFPSVPCLFQLQVVVQELRTPVPVTRTVPGQRRGSGIGCETSGAAFCLPPGQ